MTSKARTNRTTPRELLLPCNAAPSDVGLDSTSTLAPRSGAAADTTSPSAQTRPASLARRESTLWEATNGRVRHNSVRSKRASRERVTTARPLLEPGLEPLLPLLARAVSPRLRVDLALRLLLDAVVSDRGSCVQEIRHLRFCDRLQERCARLIGKIGRASCRERV